MDYNVFSLCVTLTLVVTLTVSVKVNPPKPFGTKTIYDWSFTAEEKTGKYMKYVAEYYLIFLSHFSWNIISLAHVNSANYSTALVAYFFNKCNVKVSFTIYF